MNGKQKLLFSSLFLLLGILCFSVGIWFGGFWLGGASESVIFLFNSDFYKEIYICGVAGDADCFTEKYVDFAYQNMIYAQTLIDLDITGVFTEELREAIAWNREVVEQLR